MADILYDVLLKNKATYHPVVPFDKDTNKLLKLNLTAENTDLTEDILLNTSAFSKYIDKKLGTTQATYGIGGYNEHRTIYSRSNVFTTADEPRRLHLGIDVWGPAGTPVFAPLNAAVHSTGFNNSFGDYGATIILKHEIDGTGFHTLYGHLSKKDIEALKGGDIVNRGDRFAHFGEPEENGHWPPHLHFQIVEDMQGWIGDYPGVCKFSEKAKYLENCPDPDLIIGMMQYAKT